ncbi:unnamed protein product [Symbiodinium necroappetens]|uniref:Uncharacterized protein n=1 Tax=Symbiodinium necroappetens TaxID=1628268 RepID=A0A812T9K1_9DINO|nr:unnamed protein product [Symbiodinium necroappetens]
MQDVTATPDGSSAVVHVSDVGQVAVPWNSQSTAGVLAARTATKLLSFLFSLGSFLGVWPAAGDIIAAVKSRLAEEPWHGNVVVSRGPERLESSEVASKDGLLVNLCQGHPRRGVPLEIATEILGRHWMVVQSEARSTGRLVWLRRSGITISQIQALLLFAQSMIAFWTGTFGEERGRALSYETFNLYHADQWILRPATAGRRGPGCSYVELVADTKEDQHPEWFVSHAWLEPIRLFLLCLCRHAAVRGLRRTAAYWVCAYANNQHELELAMSPNPRKTSFYKAMQLCQGVLLVLDAKATPFRRIWCCFEESIAVEERHSAALLLDVAATDDRHHAHVITDGPAGVERSVLPLIGLVTKARREESFPGHLLRRGMEVHIQTAECFKDVDKTRILNSIAYSRANTGALDDSFPEEHANYDLVNRALASHFSIASMYGCYTRQADVAPLLRALQQDQSRHTMQLSLTGCLNFRDAELRSLLEHLPAELQTLRLDLCFTGITAWTQEFEVAAVSLRHLQLRITGAASRLSGMNNLLHPSLQHLELWLANLPSLVQMELKALDQLRQVQELVMLVDGCPKLPPTSKQALRPISILICGSSNLEPGFRDAWPRATDAPPPPQLEVPRCPVRATPEQGLTCVASRRGRLEVGLVV